MLNIEIRKEHELYNQLILEYPTAPVVEANSFGADVVVSVLIPLAAILAPTISPLIIKLIGDRNVSIKYDGFEVSGDYRHVKEIIKQIKSEGESQKKECDNND